jgi:hypothetical protein
MSARDDGGPAFPIERMAAHGILAHCGMPEGEAAYIEALATMSRGMTLRDYFAAKAVNGLLAQSMGAARSSDPKFAAEYAYALADAMLEARKA